MPVYTMSEFGQTFTFKAENVEQLAERIYTRSSWTRRECVRVARELIQGRVVSAPDYETLILPGRFDILEDRPIERPNLARSYR